ncbi:hypothetical protein LEN26_000755 [Aphanomyces euteiches]|nr:hypothetical protein AeMF1_019137 [Aphanomyces euteiches]KAH9162872.1 hypothetical protein LEN26_000755 [Aphanomyces euteiches]KAH9195909.1 hypothetical protein AeNC1_002098 [Aphanomyces euteiches]
MNSSIMQRIFDREFYRIEAALDKNFDYLDRLDRARAEAIANAHARSTANGAGGPSGGKKKEKNCGVYITGLKTYIACKQLEHICHRLGRVKRIKFYKDERGSLKVRQNGDALVVFATYAMMEAAVAKLNNYEVKPGVLITAAPAEYTAKTETAGSTETRESDNAGDPDGLVDNFLQEIQQEMGVVPSAPPNLVENSPHEVGQDVISQPPSPPKVESGDASSILAQPSRSVVLRGILDAETSSDEFMDVEEDLHTECSKYGTVVQVSIRAESQLVAVEFAALDSAIECLKVMNGRWFGGQQIEAAFDQTKPEAPEDPDLMLQAFLASV